MYIDKIWSQNFSCKTWPVQFHAIPDQGWGSLLLIVKELLPYTNEQIENKLIMKCCNLDSGCSFFHIYIIWLLNAADLKKSLSLISDDG